MSDPTVFQEWRPLPAVVTAPLTTALAPAGCPDVRAVPDESRCDGADGVGPGETLHDALVESRMRWRDLVTLTADLVFETDSWGRLTFIAPDPVLGWPAESLLGQPCEMLLADASMGGFNPFRPTSAVRRRRAWLRRPDGSFICMAFASAPLLDAGGQIVGARGLGQDLTEQDGFDAAVAAALRRGEVLDHILWLIRQQVLAPRMMQAALEGLTTAMGLEGCAVLDMIVDTAEPVVLHQTGAGLETVLKQAVALMGTGLSDPTQSVTADGALLVVCPCQTRFGEQAGLLMWRPNGSRPFDADDLVLASSASGVARMILEHESIQREMARQARTDPLTTLINRRAFMDEMGRRLDRLDREGLPGTLMFIDLDNFKALNDTKGHDAGDEALCLTAALLRATVRPSDLVARLGGDEFALWMDSADEFAAAERAEALRTEGPRCLQHLAEGSDLSLTMSIGIATRWPGRGEDVEALIQRADQVMYQVKRAGRGHWRVSRPEIF